MHNALRIRYVCMFKYKFIAITDNVEENNPQNGSFLSTKSILGIETILLIVIWRSTMVINSRSIYQYMYKSNTYISILSLKSLPVNELHCFYIQRQYGRLYTGKNEISSGCHFSKIKTAEGWQDQKFWWRWRLWDAVMISTSIISTIHK